MTSWNLVYGLKKIIPWNRGYSKFETATTNGNSIEHKIIVQISSKVTTQKHLKNNILMVCSKCQEKDTTRKMSRKY